MNKFKKRLSKWFLDTAKKLDEKTVNDNCVIPIPSRNEPIIMYDQYHVDKIHAQHMIGNEILDTFRHDIRLNVEEMIKHKLVDEIRSGDKEHVRQGDLEVHGEGRGAIDTG